MEPDMNERINCVKLTYYEGDSSVKIIYPSVNIRG